MHRIAQRLLRRPWFSVLLLTALLSRALIPTGFMPGPGGVMLCPGYAALPAMSAAAEPAMDMSGMDMGVPAQHSGGTHNSPDHAGMGVCPFAGLATLIAMVHAAPATSPSEPVSTATIFPPEKFLPRGTIVPTRLPRGPPSNA
ncbi:MAG: hypothetical protein ACREU6_04720 [Steroidobacteraceae bacterium]